MCYYRYKGCGYLRGTAQVTECKKGNITLYAVAVKKEGIIVGDLP